MGDLSPYAKSLSKEAGERYKKKLEIINGLDPFNARANGELADCLPPLEAADIVSYLVLQTSFITAREFKARKGLEAYNQFVSGWVKDVCSRKVAGKHVVTGRVRHSQRLSETALSCWLIIEETGEVCCAHCNCMAGLGETCTHIAAVLFYLEANTRIRGIKTCTQKECEWIIPSSLKTIEYLPTKDIDFSSARGKKRKLDEMMEIDDPPEFSCDLVTVSQGASPTDLEMKLLFEKLNLAGTKPAILSLIPPYSDEYVPKSSGDILPKPLKSLHQPSYLQLEYNELLNICETVLIQVADEMAEALEKETRLQSKSNLWYKHRAGRVTSSCMKAVCHTNVANPAQSLVKSICYPQELAFSSKQTDWGQKYEKVAREQYLKSQRPRHANILEVKDSGIVINPKWPFIGASPDGIVDCYCCGKGVLEIKCPYSHRHESIEAAASNDPNFCLKKDEDLLYLDHKHAYYYQVQTQMFVCNVEYCDFCVCTFPESVDEFSPYVERIFRDIEFWEDCVEKAKHFFTVCLLPEILGKWYTQPAVSSGTNESNQSNSSNNEVEQ